MNKRIAVLGGDLRQAAVGEYFRKKGCDVRLWGFDYGIDTNDMTVCGEINDAARGADAVILPIPAFASGYLCAPFSESRAAFSDIDFAPGIPVFGGRLDSETLEKFKAMGVPAVDYLKFEDLAVKNAVPTAEGAVELAMSELAVTLSSCRVLVMGWGRIGRILAKMLSGIGADTVIYARRCESRAFAEALGFEALDDAQLDKTLGGFDVIFNTIPAIIIGKERLHKIKQDALIIDLASNPGGVSMDDARSLSRRVIWALSLPGKCAPVTSGHIIAEAVMHRLEGGEQNDT